MTMPTIKFRRLPHAGDLPVPSYATVGSVGMDLRAALGVGEVFVLPPRCSILVPSGFAMELPFGFEAQVRPRSGLALKHGITVLNSPGTIDADYRGEVMVLLVNHGDEPFTIRRGERIAQLVVAPVARAVVVNADTLSYTHRGAGGFGSTGR